MSSIVHGIKNFFGWVGDEIEKIPHTVSVAVGGVEHAIEGGYGAGKVVVHDVYGAGKTAVSGSGLNFATSTEHLLASTEHDMLAPVTGTIQSFSYPVMAIAGGLGLMLIWQAGQTTRASLPYLPSIVESGAKVAPLFGKMI